MSELTVPGAISELRRQISQTGDVDSLLLPLRVLQRRGFDKTDLVVHVEKVRVRNQSGERDSVIEQRCIEALELIYGTTSGPRIEWDARHDAASLASRSITIADVRGSLAMAVLPSDLLPPRAPWDLQDDIAAEVSRYAEAHLKRPETLPAPAVFVRAPRGAFTSRPAALLDLWDRVTLEALCGQLDGELEQRLPPNVLWPRYRSQQPSAVLRDSVLAWDAKYIVKADISDFYGSVSHDLLSLFLANRVGLSTLKSRAISRMLTAVMGTECGLPQGPQFSDVLASAYLLSLDELLVETSQRYVRYADDYFFPADSMKESRQILEQLESRLRDISLSLNAEKTSIMRASTFRTSGGQSRLRNLKEALAQEELDAMPDDADDLGDRLLDAGVEDQEIWDLLYHQTLDTDEIIRRLSERVGPEYGRSYLMFLSRVAGRLRSRRPGDIDFATANALAKESLLFLSRSNYRVPAGVLTTIQLWFPALAPDIVRYLGGGSRKGQKWTEAHLRRSIKALSVDWAKAWYCYGVSRRTSIAEDTADLLSSIVENESEGPLTRIESLKSLAVHRLATDEQIASVTQTLPRPMLAEIRLAAFAEPHLYDPEQSGRFTLGGGQ